VIDLTTGDPDVAEFSIAQGVERSLQLSTFAPLLKRTRIPLE
jgi:hypothetical protein